MMDLEHAMEWLGIATAVARGLLAVCDALDDKFPKLRAVTDALGTLLGGRKARYADEG